MAFGKKVTDKLKTILGAHAATMAQYRRSSIFGGGAGNTRASKPIHTAGPYVGTTGGSSTSGVPTNSKPLKWNERL